MDGPHDEDETEPGDVPIVVLEGVVRVSLRVWIQVLAKFTFDLHAQQVEYGAQNLPEEHEQFDENPPLSLFIPCNEIFRSIHEFDSSILLLVENSVHNCA